MVWLLYVVLILVDMVFISLLLFLIEELIDELDHFLYFKDFSSFTTIFLYIVLSCVLIITGIAIWFIPKAVNNL